MSGANVGGFNYTHLSGAATTTILAGVGASQATASSPANTGVLQDVVINTLGTTPVVTVYDGPNSSGSVVAIITPTAPGNQFSSPIQLKSGLTVTVAGSAATDVTVLWA